VASGFVHYAQMFSDGYYLAEPDVLLLANMVPYHHDRTDPRYEQERESESDEEDEDLPDLLPVVSKLTENEESEPPQLLEEDDDDIVHASRAVMKTGPQYTWYVDDAIEWTERVVGEGGETHAHARPSLQWAREAMKANAQASEGQVRSPVSGLVLERQGLIMEIHAWLDYIVKVNEGSRRPDHVNLMPMTLLSLKKTVMKLKEHIHKIDSTIRMANGGADVPIHEILNYEESDSRWTRVEELDVRWMEGVQPRWVLDLGCDVNAAFHQQLMKPDSNRESLYVTLPNDISVEEQAIRSASRLTDEQLNTVVNTAGYMLEKREPVWFEERGIDNPMSVLDYYCLVGKSSTMSRVKALWTRATTQTTRYTVTVVGQSLNAVVARDMLELLGNDFGSLLSKYAKSEKTEARQFGRGMNRARLELLLEVTRFLGIENVDEMIEFYDMETLGLLYVDMRARATAEQLRRATEGRCV